MGDPGYDLSPIVSLHGQPLPDPEKPDPVVVKALERLLKLAKDGQIRGIAYTVQYPDEGCVSWWCGEAGLNQIGSLVLLQHNMVEALQNSG